jgi:hypothetical protein
VCHGRKQRGTARGTLLFAYTNTIKPKDGECAVCQANFSFFKKKKIAPESPYTVAQLE